MSPCLDEKGVTVRKAVKSGIWLLAAVNLLMGCTAVAPTETESLPEKQWIFTSSYAQAYYDLLQEYTASCTPAERELLRFGLAFIDADDIPELLIFPDNSHAAGVEVYTYTPDRLVKIGVFGSFGAMQYVKREGMIFSTFMGQGESYSDFIHMEDGESILVSSLHSWPDYSGFLETGEYTEFYEIDDLPVTEDAFEAMWEELYDKQEYVLIGYEDGISLKDAELLPALAHAIENLSRKRDCVNASK